MARRNDIEWDAIEGDYRAGKLSEVQIAKNHGISRSTLQSKAKRLEWPRDLSAAVEHATKAALIEHAKRNAEEIGRKIGQESGSTITSSVEAAATQNLTVILAHIGRLVRLHALAAATTEELEALSGRTTELQQLIKAVAGSDPIAAKELSKAVSLPSRIASIERLTNIEAKIITLERQAHNIDSASVTGDTYEDRLRRLAESSPSE